MQACEATQAVREAIGLPRTVFRTRRMSTTAVRTRLDLLILCATMCYFTVAVLFRYVLWGGLDTLEHSLSARTPDFIAEFTRRTDAARLLLFPLGTASLLFVLGGLVREGGLTASRGLLR